MSTLSNLESVISRYPGDLMSFIRSSDRGLSISLCRYLLEKVGLSQIEKAEIQLELGKRLSSEPADQGEATQLFLNIINNNGLTDSSIQLDASFEYNLLYPSEPSDASAVDQLFFHEHT